MSRGMHPKFDYEHIVFGFNRGLYISKEKQSHLDDLTESHLNTLTINIGTLARCYVFLPLSAILFKKKKSV